MANDRNYDFPNSYDRDADGYGRDFGRDFGSGRDYTYSGAREDRNFRGGGTGYGGDRGYRPDNLGGRESYGAGNRDYYGGSNQQRFGGGEYRGASDRNRFSETGDQDRGRDVGQDRGRDVGRNRDYGRAPQGYDYQDRGFVARAGDELRSWFGDEEAERRREYDQRYDERTGATTGYGRDADYHGWRRSQIDALDRDYHEYRQENAKRFENEFGTWRNNRQTQRQALAQVKEHMDVVGSDGGHVGTVDTVRGDRIILTKADSDSGGRHHSIPSSWIKSVDDTVTISKTADDAHTLWRDEETSGALFGAEDRSTGRDKDGTVNLNRSFSGTY